MFKIFHVKNFRGFHCPQKFFTNEIFPDYGICICVVKQMLLLIPYLLLLQVFIDTNTYPTTTDHDF